MALNEFSISEESHVANTACEANADCFLNAAGIIHHDFVSEGTTVNSHYYLEVRKCL
jgi:hypothetical protein